MFMFSGDYINISMGLTALSLLCTIAILHIFHHSAETPVPVWLRNVVLQQMSGLLHCDKTSTIMATSTVDALVRESILQQTRDTHEQGVQPLRNDSIFTQAGSVPQNNGENNSNVNSNRKPTGGVALMHIKLLQQKRKLNREKNKNDWQNVARVLDRFILIVIMSIVFFMSLYVFVRIVYGI